tara:strand:- start:8196 stop:8684 length:489 start_codon:yes stop_codon:yes gene_type:complete
MAKTQTNRSHEVIEKYEEVVRLRSIGLSFQQIADRVGYAGRQGAKEAYSQAIKMWGGEAVDELRILENERLDHLWRTVIGQLETAQRQKADPQTIVHIVNGALNISKRRAALYGIDAPRQVELSGVNGGALETDIGQLLRERLTRLEEINRSGIEAKILKDV